MISENILKTPSPGIAEINLLVEKMKKKGEGIINLGQAVPYYGPCERTLDFFKNELGKSHIHRYTSDPGLIELREHWSSVLAEKFNFSFSPSEEIIITAGANQAYLCLIMALFNPGDKMGLLTPYYFNHSMAVKMVGGEIVEIPLSPENGFRINPDQIIEMAKRNNLKALTIVTPNNPTGTTYSPEALEYLANGLLRNGIYLVVDETYAFFPDPEIGHFSPGSLESKPERIITVGSFSKTFALTGWRCGYIIASKELTHQMMKIQDTMVICAPHASQKLVLLSLEFSLDWIKEKKDHLAQRALKFKEKAETFKPWKLLSSGLFFAFVQGPANGRQTVLDILEKEKLVMIPGDIFGSDLSKTIRISLGCSDDSSFFHGIDKLSSYFSQFSAQ
ncbi:MAG: pyridoxal phosphate-dependent aminotransferase [Candidatus Riflebacteria bacterium]|nr:pyridoxal phosphate-dependent aminotransferase [Candidatus Riflebacteria bacterium]